MYILEVLEMLVLCNFVCLWDTEVDPGGGGGGGAQVLRRDLN